MFQLHLNDGKMDRQVCILILENNYKLSIHYSQERREKTGNYFLAKENTNLE